MFCSGLELSDRINYVSVTEMAHIIGTFTIRALSQSFARVGALRLVALIIMLPLYIKLLEGEKVPMFPIF